MNLARIRRFFGLDERRCVLCREPFSPEEGGVLAEMLCPACRPLLRRRTAGFCPHCGEPFALEEAPLTPCESCLQALPPWDGFLFFGLYEGALRDLVLSAKFGGSLPSLDILGHLMSEVCVEHYASAPKPHCIVPVPLHRSRLQERGFNQSVELARPLARALDIPLYYDRLVRVKATVPQASLKREQRRELRQPFFASPEVSGLRVLLLDDVCTTGATLTRAAQSLREAGASRVDVVVAARTSRHSPAGNGSERP